MKSSISQKIVPRNRHSKSMEGKQFINVRLGPDIVTTTIAWSKLMPLCVPLPFICHFLAERFHTLKIESEFFSRQGHCTLCRTSVYHGLLLKKNQRRSSFYFLTKMSKVHGIAPTFLTTANRFFVLLLSTLLIVHKGKQQVL